MRSDKILSLNLDLNLLIENAIFHSFLNFDRFFIKNFKFLNLCINYFYDYCMMIKIITDFYYLFLLLFYFVGHKQRQRLL